MNIAFDVHGTLDNDEMLVNFVKMLYYVDDRINVFIISGPPTEQIEKEITKIGIDKRKVKIISVVDYLKSKNVSMNKDKEGDWWCDEKIWWSSKGWICSEYSIDIIFDDLYKYTYKMPISTRFILWKGQRYRISGRRK